MLSSHTREAQKMAALGRWLLNRGEYQYKFNIWEHFVWLLRTGCCLIEVTANTGLTVCYCKNHLPEYMGEGIPVSFSSNSNLTPPVLVVRTPHPPLRHSDIGTTPYTYPSRIGTPIPENIEENMQSNCQLQLTTGYSTQ